MRFWFHPSLLFNVNNYLITILASVAVIGDYIVAHAELHLFQALFDNVTHAIIGGLSWLFVCLNFKNYSSVQALIDIALCAAVASLIDLDHFIAARSFYLKDATNLSRRPPFHCSTFPLVFCLILLLISYIFQLVIWKKVSLIILTAFLSHHTRDATRRGYWFHPFGSTPPIPYHVYVGVTCVIPYFIFWLQTIVKIKDTNYYKYVHNESVI